LLWQHRPHNKIGSDCHFPWWVNQKTFVYPNPIAQFSEEAHVPIELVPESKEELKEKSKERPANLSTGKSSKSSGESNNSSGKFSCEEKKTCGQMTSCEEAKYHLTICGNKKLDRDNDNVPCESICE
jgi:hypothetical protein